MEFFIIWLNIWLINDLVEIQVYYFLPSTETGSDRHICSDGPL